MYCGCCAPSLHEYPAWTSFGIYSVCWLAHTNELSESFMVLNLAGLRAVAEYIQGRRERTSRTPPVSYAAAAALEWAAEPARAQGITSTVDGLEVTRGFAGPQPAVLFAAPSKVRTPGLLETAALFAYHASIEWGVFLDLDGPIVFNSHWVRNDAWFRLPPIPWTLLEADGGVLNEMTPDGITSGRIDSIATNSFK